MKRIISLIMAILLLTSLGTPKAQAQKQVSESNPASDERSNEVEQLINEMNDIEKIGQLVMTSTQTGVDGMPNDFTKEMIQEYGVGSVIVRGATTQAEYNNQLQEYAEDTRMNIPLFTSADLENGVTQQRATTFPFQMGVGATNSLTHAETFARIVGQEANALGFNWTYSPVADVNVNPLNPVIGVRSFGEHTELVSEMVATQVVAYQDEGVIATAKHFPGHGNTETDSHFALPSVTYDREELEEIHLPPFQAAINAGIDSIMTAHIIIESIDPDLPATLSEEVLTEVLREDMGFDGLIVTDDMGMQAITDNWGAGEAALMSIQAGADIVMTAGGSTPEVHEALYNAYQSGELTEERVHESLERILKKKLEYDLFNNRFVDPTEAGSFVGNKDHKMVAEQIALDSMTLVKNNDVLPFESDSEETTLVAGVTHVNDVAAQVEHQSNGDVISWQADSSDPTSEEISDVFGQAAEADRILILTYSAGELSEGQTQMVQALMETEKPMAAVSLGLPYDLQNYPEIDAYIASYALDGVATLGLDNPKAINAAVDVVFGEEPGGKLPVTIEDQYPFGHGLSYSPSSASYIKNIVKQYAEEEFENDEVVRSLDIHLTAVSHYENQEDGDKVVRHMEAFKILLDHQRDNNLISLEVFNSLRTHADTLIGDWQ